MALRKLPNELLSKIHHQLLNDLDITTVKEFDDSGMGQDEVPKYTIPTSYVLDPATLSLIRYYSDELFVSALEWKNPIWEHHVRFVFPSALEMADVFATYQAAGRLDQIRNIKVLERGFVTSDVVKINGIIRHVANFLDFYLDLKLDHLEYEHQRPVLNAYASGLAVRDCLRRTLVSPGWKKLSILTPKHHFDQQGVDKLIEEFDKVARADHTDKYTFELPCTPTIKDASGKVTGLDIDKRPTDVEQIHGGATYPSQVWHGASTPSWLGGTAVCNEIVVRRARYGFRLPPSLIRDGDDFMRRWTAGKPEI